MIPILIVHKHNPGGCWCEVDVTDPLVLLGMIFLLVISLTFLGFIIWRVYGV